LAVSGLVGCRNRVADERDALWNQNRQQQAELDRQKAEAEAARQQAELERQRALAAQQQQQQAPAPAPAPEAKPVDQIGGLPAVENKYAGTVTVNLPGDIFFDSGAATIRQPARQSLDKVAAALQKDYSGKMVRIEGHTDADPIKKSKWKSNQELSMARAAAVRDYLVKKGVSSDAIETTGFGADKPRSQKKAENRRVEVVVVVDANAPGAAAAAQAPSTPTEQSEPSTVDTREFNK
jgi:flagellar motor protein MotB